MLLSFLTFLNPKYRSSHIFAFIQSQSVQLVERIRVKRRILLLLNTFSKTEY